MSLDRARHYIMAADAISSLGFYVIGYDPSNGRIHCRTWDSLGNLPKQEAETLVDELNTAMEPVIRKYAAMCLERVQGAVELVQREFRETGCVKAK